MEYQVVIEEFQGPLDLLLHLIKEKEMDLETLELSVPAIYSCHGSIFIRGNVRVFSYGC